MIITKLGALSCAKALGLLYGGLGLLFGAGFSLLRMTGFTSGFLGKEGGALGTFIDFGAVLLLPIGYGLLGFVCTFLFVSLYNLDLPLGNRTVS